MSLKQVKALFLIASIYDCLAGLGFALLFRPIYEYFNVEMPNHAGYVQLPGLLILVFGIGFYLVYVDPVRNLSLIALGILMKLVFVAVVLWHTLFGSIPLLYQPFAVADLIFMVLFIAAHVSVRKQSEETL